MQIPQFIPQGAIRHASGLLFFFGIVDSLDAAAMGRDRIGEPFPLQHGY
jgi:hypothetical protein